MTLYTMKKPEEKRRAVLAGICLKDDTLHFEASLSECVSLCEATGIEAVCTITQNSRYADPSTGFRKGKLEELLLAVQQHDAELVVFVNPLSVKVANRIAEIVGVEVIDRTAVILDIFSRRARTKQAKLQTEMARLQYDLPRVLENNMSGSGHERGGSAYNRGAGEMRSAVIKRKYRERITDLKRELEKIDTQVQQDEARRSRTLLKRAALVGYTNAGKSSLMNAMLRKADAAGSEVMEKDMLFATLDTSVRMIQMNRKAYLLYDTVGFVSDLPHTLVEAFHTTLAAAREADLLIHVIDLSDPDRDEKTAITDETLKDIGADNIPVLRVFTKSDLAEEDQKGIGLAVSSLTGEGIQELNDEILKRLYPEECVIVCQLPYSQSGLLNKYGVICTIDIEDQNEEGYLIKVKGPAYAAEVFRPYEVQ